MPFLPPNQQCQSTEGLQVEMFKKHVFLRVKYFVKYFSIFVFFLQDLEKKSSNKSWVLFSQCGNALVQIIA